MAVLECQGSEAKEETMNECPVAWGTNCIDKLEAVRKLLEANTMAVKLEDGSTVHTYTDVNWQQLADILNSTEDQT